MVNHPLLTEPLWRAEDLGKPIPDSPHAVSVALPTWQSVIGYEENDPEVIKAMELGYPRFVYHPLVERLFTQCRERFAQPGEIAHVYPSRKVAGRCVDFVQAQSGHSCRIESYGVGDVYAVLGPDAASDAMKYFWQHVGDTTSSRYAQALLEGRLEPAGGEDAKAAIRNRIAEYTGAAVEDVLLYPTGMSALAAIQRVLQKRTPNAKTIQLGFPYVDLIKLQQKIGAGFTFLTDDKLEMNPEFSTAIASESIAGVFTDSPGNPLLGCAHFPRLWKMLRSKNIPLVVDETIGGYLNVDVLPHVDVAMTSLTKYFCGISDTLGGALIFNATSPLYENLHRTLEADYEDLLWGEDAVMLEERSRDYPERMGRINVNTEALADYLHEHPRVQEVYYPKYCSRENYDVIKRPGGGYGGLLSFVLHDAAKRTPACYDALRICKGPSFGTNYSLACPYILLAHYDELDWAESHGLSRYLIRVGVGMEDTADLIERFEAALPSR